MAGAVVGRTRKLRATIEVYDPSLPPLMWGSSKIPMKMDQRAFFFLNRARESGTPLTFIATGPDAHRAIRIIEDACTNPVSLPDSGALMMGWKG